MQDATKLFCPLLAPLQYLGTGVAEGRQQSLPAPQPLAATASANASGSHTFLQSLLVPQPWAAAPPASASDSHGLLQTPPVPQPSDSHPTGLSRSPTTEQLLGSPNNSVSSPTPAGTTHQQPTANNQQPTAMQYITVQYARSFYLSTVSSRVALACGV